jgi:hypothetical protein
MPCHAMRCYAIPCHAMPCHAMLCYAMPCYAMPCHAMPCYAMLCHAMPCYAMPCYAMLCHAMPCYAMLCYAIETRLVQRSCLYASKGVGRRRRTRTHQIPPRWPSSRSSTHSATATCLRARRGTGRWIATTCLRRTRRSSTRSSPSALSSSWSRAMGTTCSTRRCARLPVGTQSARCLEPST